MVHTFSFGSYGAGAQLVNDGQVVKPRRIACKTCQSGQSLTCNFGMGNYLRTMTNSQIGLLIVMHIVFNYFITVCFCRQNLQKGGVCIFFRKDLYFRNFNISRNCKEKDLEICAVEL
jgi:hypothetical protein